MGERVGKMRKFPPLGSGRVTWVDDASGIETMRTAVLDPSTRTTRRPLRRPLRRRRRRGARRAVGGGSGRGVASAQALAGGAAAGGDARRGVSRGRGVADATRRRRDDRYDRYDRYDANAEAFDAFLRDLLDAPDVVRLGFGFEYDLSRLRRGYAGRLSSLERRREAQTTTTDENRVNEFGETGHALGARVVDVKALALCAFPDKQKLARVGLATLVASVLGAYVDKTEQCSDWERRPLTTDQVDYAAADAHVLTVLFDRCFNHAPAAVAEALADPAAPLARAPGRTEADERTRSRTGGGEEETRRRGEERPPRSRPAGGIRVRRAGGAAAAPRRGSLGGRRHVRGTEAGGGGVRRRRRRRKRPGRRRRRVRRLSRALRQRGADEPAVRERVLGRGGPGFESHVARGRDVVVPGRRRPEGDRVRARGRSDGGLRPRRGIRKVVSRRKLLCCFCGPRRERTRASGG